MTYQLFTYQYSIPEVAAVLQNKSNLLKLFFDKTVWNAPETLSDLDESGNIFLLTRAGYASYSGLSKEKSGKCASEYLERCKERLYNAIQSRQLAPAWGRCLDWKLKDAIPVMDDDKPNLVRYWQCFFDYSLPAWSFRNLEFGFSNILQGSTQATLQDVIMRIDVTKAGNIIGVYGKLLPVTEVKKIAVEGLSLTDGRLPETLLFLEETPAVITPVIADSKYGFRSIVSSEQLLGDFMSGMAVEVKDPLPLFLKDAKQSGMPAYV